jgi:hypothetical protein
MDAWNYRETLVRLDDLQLDLLQHPELTRCSVSGMPAMKRVGTHPHGDQIARTIHLTGNFIRFCNRLIENCEIAEIALERVAL